MATATKEKVFNYELFRKRVRLFDSSVEGERNVAINQALEQCKRNEPPLHFWEAAGTAFGSTDNGVLERLEERADAAQAEAENQRKAASRFADAARQEREISDGLRVENARLAEDLRRVSEEQQDATWPDIPPLRPRVLFVTLVIAVAAEWMTITPLGRSAFGDNAPLVAEGLHVLAMALFLLWSIANYKCSGMSDLFGSWAVWAGTWVTVAVLIATIDRTFDLGTLAFKQMVVPYRWWGTMGANFSSNDCLIVFLVLAVVVELELGMPVTRKILELAKEGIIRLLGELLDAL